MPINFSVKSYSCDYVDFGVNENGQVAVAFYGNFPSTGKMTVDEVSAFVNDPLFAELFRLAYENAKIGTPVFHAFEREKSRIARGEKSTVMLKFEQSDFEVPA